METVRDFIFLGSKITAYGDCSHGIKRCLLLGSKAMTNLDGVLKSGYITLPTKVCLVKAMVFPVIMYRCWMIKMAECWRNDASKLVLDKTLESPLDCKEIQPVNPKGNQSWIFIRRADAEVPILWPPDVKSQFIRKDWCWARLKAGGEGDDRGQDGWMESLTRRIWIWASSWRGWRTGKPGMV